MKSIDDIDLTIVQGITFGPYETVIRGVNSLNAALMTPTDDLEPFDLSDGYEVFFVVYGPFRKHVHKCKIVDAKNGLIEFGCDAHHTAKMPTGLVRWELVVKSPTGYTTTGVAPSKGELRIKRGILVDGEPDFSNLPIVEYELPPIPTNSDLKTAMNMIPEFEGCDSDRSFYVKTTNGTQLISVVYQGGQFFVSSPLSIVAEQ